jgi:hypothetical protein
MECKGMMQIAPDRHCDVQSSSAEHALNADVWRAQRGNGIKVATAERVGIGKNCFLVQL